MSMALELRGITVVHHGRTVLDLGAFTLATGRTLAVLGPNGAGKSTLLRVAGLLQRPTTGTVALFGETIGERRADRLVSRRRMASVFQDPLLTDATVLENVVLGLRFRGADPAIAHLRARRWLDRFGVGSLSSRRARTLSGGEARRVSLARAFVLEPDVLLLDEPFSSLDPYGRQALALELREILAESHLTALIITHERNEAQVLADDAVVLMDGRPVQRASPQEVFERPLSLEVARFVGVENLIPAEDIGRLGGLGLSPNRYATCFAIRAEDVVVGEADRPAPEGAVGLRVTVTRVVPVGVQYRLELDAGVPLIALVEKRVVAHHQPEPGKAMKAWFDRGAIHPLLP